ncbi:SDR family oxidoreductase [Labrenzia sp. PHM005]|uniref:SDR family oxidoreductase n=1 Tax=Labrenzia sp. PHM005 TaxID=2590016 RepID=UPI00114026F4|nr:SDR family oxidoreductase [Labrenzia sp. PHM005]QDG75819.1 SDR family oxidoreductase [Labrenzia sp. PHM005]
MSKIEGKAALVTGANRGIGRAFVEELLSRGVAKVYAGARNTDNLKDLVAENGGKVVALKLDVTNAEDISAAAANKDVALVVNNAGTAGFSSFTTPGADERGRLEMETNFFGTLNVSQAFAPVLKENGGGAIINIGSIASHINFPVLGTYSASKAAVHSLTQGLRAELAGQGTQVVGVYPGPVDTDMAEQFDADKTAPQEVVRQILDALENGEENVFPDPTSTQLYEQFLAAPDATAKFVGQTYLPG